MWNNFRIKRRKTCIFVQTALSSKILLNEESYWDKELFQTRLSQMHDRI